MISQYFALKFDIIFTLYIFSSPTRVDAVWRALRPFKEGWNFLLEPLIKFKIIDNKVRVASCYMLRPTVELEERRSEVDLQPNVLSR